MIQLFLFWWLLLIHFKLSVLDELFLCMLCYAAFFLVLLMLFFQACHVNTFLVTFQKLYFVLQLIVSPVCIILTN